MWPYSPPSEPLLPDERGFFGEFGGCFVPEILVPNLEELSRSFKNIRSDREFWQTYTEELATFSGRPTPISYAGNLSREIGGAQIYLKREDLNQSGAHKINNVIGQGLMAKRLGKSRVIAETGAGQHGVATATMAARLGLEAVIYMGAVDVERQRPNVFWMERLGAKVVVVSAGSATLKDAINEAMRDWSSHVEGTHYILGTACGPHPFPTLVAWLQSVIGIEARGQMDAWVGPPNRVYACVGGGSNALGVFQGFLSDNRIQLIGCEAGGDGGTRHASRLAGGQGSSGTAQGYRTMFLQDAEGQMQETHSVAAGLDYVGVSPILAHLAKEGTVRMESASDTEVIDAAQRLMRTEGIIPALESSHGLAVALREAAAMGEQERLLVNLSGRGDKDIFTIADAFADERWHQFLDSRAKTL